MKSTDHIRDLYRQYLEAERKGDAKAIALFYAEDALLIPPEQKPIEGNSAWATGLFYWNTDDQRRYLAFLDCMASGERRVAIGYLYVELI